MCHYFKDLLALQEYKEAMDTMGLDRKSIIIDNVYGEETDQLHGIPLLDHDLLNLSHLVMVVNQPNHDDIQVQSWIMGLSQSHRKWTLILSP